MGQPTKESFSVDRQQFPKELSAKLAHTVLLAVIQEFGIPGSNLENSGHAGPNGPARGRASQTRRANVRKDAVRASGDAEAVRRLGVAEKYNEDGFRAHGKKIKKAEGDYRKKHGKDSVTPEDKTQIRARFGSAPTKLLENRARIIIRYDLPMLASKPNFNWATNTKMRKRADLEPKGGGHKANTSTLRLS
ncbi:hypothetical protein KCU85_g9568, partial [Aureobasidium melanogenum]